MSLETGVFRTPEIIVICCATTENENCPIIIVHDATATFGNNDGSNPIGLFAKWNRHKRKADFSDHFQSRLYQLEDQENSMVAPSLHQDSPLMKG